MGNKTNMILAVMISIVCQTLYEVEYTQVTLLLIDGKDKVQGSVMPVY
jgi:hypothetical protein